jgi:hypothetical protein
MASFVTRAVKHSGTATGGWANFFKLYMEHALWRINHKDLKEFPVTTNTLLWEKRCVGCDLKFL